jgi:hypothetical protein
MMWYLYWLRQVLRTTPITAHFLNRAPSDRCVLCRYGVPPRRSDDTLSATGEVSSE